MKVPRNGFTLIELLVALAVVGLASGMLLAGVGTVALAAVQLRGGAARADEVVAAQSLIAGRIERLRPVLRLDSADAIVDAQGDEASFDWIAPPLDRDGPDALRRYRLAANSAGDVLLYTAGTLDPRIEPGELQMRGWTPLRLVQGAGGLTISYYGPDQLGGERRWQSRWNAQPQAPDLVRVRLAFPDRDKRRWPDLVIRPRASLNAACRIDVLTGRCSA